MNYLRILALVAVSSGVACHKDRSGTGTPPDASPDGGVRITDSGRPVPPGPDGGLVLRRGPAGEVAVGPNFMFGAGASRTATRSDPDAGTRCVQPIHERGVAIKTGDPMPDCVGAVASIEIPVINADGTIAFTARARGDRTTAMNEYAVLSGTVDSLVILSRGGDPLPGGGGAFAPVAADHASPFRTVPLLGDDGRVAVVAAYSATSSRAEALGAFILDDVAIAFDGLVAPDVSGAVFAMGLDSAVRTSFAFGADSSYAIVEQLIEPTSARDFGVFAGKAGVLAKLGHTGDVAPGGARFANLGDEVAFGPPGIGPSGVVAFVGREKVETSTAGGRPTADALFRKTPDKDLERVIGALQSSSTLDGQTDLLEALNDPAHPPAINTDGDVAMLVRMVSAARAILVLRGNTVLTAAREGDLAPSGDAYGEIRWQPSINDRGQIAFVAGVTPPPDSGRVEGQAIFLGSPEALRMVVRSGDPTPERDGVFLSFAALPDPRAPARHEAGTEFHLIAGDQPNLNQLGQLAFLAEVGAAGGERAVGLYAFDGARLVKVVRYGDDQGGKSVVDIGFQSVMGPGARALNDRCEVAFVTARDDQTLALWVVNPCMRGD